MTLSSQSHFQLPSEQLRAATLSTMSLSPSLALVRETQTQRDAERSLRVLTHEVMPLTDLISILEIHANYSVVEVLLDASYDRYNAILRRLEPTTRTLFLQVEPRGGVRNVLRMGVKNVVIHNFAKIICQIARTQTPEDVFDSIKAIMIFMIEESPPEQGWPSAVTNFLALASNPVIGILPKGRPTWLLTEQGIPGDQTA